MIGSMHSEIVGRDAALVQIHAFLDRPAGGIRALVLEGEAGIGKSALWLAATAAADERLLHVLSSRPAEAERRLAYLVLGDLFRQVPAEILEQLPAPRRRALDAALLRADGAGTLDPRALGVAVQSVLRSLAAGRPVVIAIDDDQWLDASTAATLRFALRRLEGESLLLLLARRTGASLLADDGAAGNGAAEDDAEPGLQPWHGLEGTSSVEDVQRVLVGPLAAGALDAVIRARLGTTPPRPVLRWAYELSGGNALHAIELVRSRSADIDGDRADTPAPASYERLVQARLNELGDGARQALLVIAASGRPTAQILRDLTISEEVLEEARATGFIEPSGGTLRFTHPLLAATVYRTAGEARRREAHARLASVLADDLDRARHRALAATGEDPALAEELESVARAGADRGLPLVAAELAGHARRLTPASLADLHHRRGLAMARAFLAAGDAQRARASISDLVDRRHPARARAAGLVLLAELEHPATAIGLLEEALEHARGERRLEAAVHTGLAQAGRLINGLSWAERHAIAALRIADELDDDSLRTTALIALSPLRFDAGDPAAFVMAERALALAIAGGSAEERRGAGENLAQMLVWSGRSAAARDLIETELTHWADRDEQARADFHWYFALNEAGAGDLLRAAHHADEALEIHRQYGVELPAHLLPSAIIALRRGRFDEARALSRRALELAGGQQLMSHLAVLATAEAWTGNLAEAIGLYQQAEAAGDAREILEPGFREWRPEFVEALVLAGELSDAIRLLDDWEAAVRRLDRTGLVAAATRCRGLLAAASGDLDVAETLLVTATEHGDAAGMFQAARAQLALGIVRRRARKKREARTALTSARSTFEAIGAESWAKVAVMELERIGGGVRVEGLSPSEARVAALVAEGRTNREIARALFLAERTVASHLTHIYAKLGIRSQTELTRQLITNVDLGANKPGTFPTF